MIIRILGIIRIAGLLVLLVLLFFFFSRKYVMCILKSIVVKALVVEISIISNALKASLPELHGDLKSLF